MELDNLDAAASVEEEAAAAAAAKPSKEALPDGGVSLKGITITRSSATLAQQWNIF